MPRETPPIHYTIILVNRQHIYIIVYGEADQRCRAMCLQRQQTEYRKVTPTGINTLQELWL